MNTVPTLILTDGLERKDLLADLMDSEVHVTELVRGSEITFVHNGTSFCLYENGVEVEPEQVGRRWNSSHWALLSFLRDFKRLAPEEVDEVTLRAILGADRLLRAFDLEMNGETVPPYPAFSVFQSWGIPTVPVLSLPGQTLYRWLNRRPPEQAACGRSRVLAKPRAGVVIRPATEINHPEIGRLVLKLESGE